MRRPEPKAPVETVDLLAPKKKVKRADTETLKARALPPISSIHAREAAAAAPAPSPAPVPELEPEPEAPVAEEAPVVEETAPYDGRKVIHLKASITVKELAPVLGLKPFQVIADLMSLNIFANINQTSNSIRSPSFATSTTSFSSARRRTPRRATTR